MRWSLRLGRWTATTVQKTTQKQKRKHIHTACEQVLGHLGQSFLLDMSTMAWYRTCDCGVQWHGIVRATVVCNGMVSYVRLWCLPHWIRFTNSYVLYKKNVEARQLHYTSHQDEINCIVFSKECTIKQHGLFFKNMAMQFFKTIRWKVFVN